MGNTELEKLLGDDSSSATPADAKPADDVQKRIDEAVSKVTEGFKGRIDSLQGKIGTLESENEKLKTLSKPLEALQPKAEEKKEETFDPSSAEGWKTHIKETSQSAANEAVEKIEQSALNKAKESFLAAHPEYKEPTKFETLLSLSKGIGVKDKFDKDSWNDALDAAWTVENRQKLREQAALAERLQAQTDQNLVDLASSGASNPVKIGMDTPDATSSDIRAYREYQRTGGELPLAKFLELSRNV